MNPHHPDSEALEIQLARPPDTDRLSLTLARAFQYDPPQCWLIPDETARFRKSQRIFAIFLRSLIPCGTVFTTSGLEGAALWEAPQQSKPGVSEQIKLGLQILPILGANIARGFRWQLLLGAKQPRYPHWYLLLLGVAPDHQNKGIGSALLRPMLKRCDTEQVRAYLETGNEKNVLFYRRMGFEITGKVRLPGGPTVFQMVRHPASQGV